MENGQQRRDQRCRSDRRHARRPMSSRLVALASLGALLSPGLGHASDGPCRPNAAAADAADARMDARMHRSPQWDPKNRVFHNTKKVTVMAKKASTWDQLKRFIANGNITRPPQRLPETKPDLRAFLKDPKALKTIWLGHSTVLLQMAGEVVVFAPVLSTYASPVPGVIKRFQPPVLSVRELPTIDMIVISHDHYDHLDRTTVRQFRQKKTRFLVPLGVGAHLRGWGIAADRITELDWWESHVHGGLTYTLTPAQHFSGRGLTDRNATLWGSWVVRSPTQRVFFSGDGGYNSHFKKIGAKYGPFDVVYLENGQYSPDWPTIHMMPSDGARAAVDLRGRRMVPIHWGMFDLSSHNWWDPIEAISREAKARGVDLMTPLIGQVVDVRIDRNFTRWWAPLIGKE